jgi:hypothetical protein
MMTQKSGNKTNATGKAGFLIPFLSPATEAVGVPAI